MKSGPTTDNLVRVRVGRAKSAVEQDASGQDDRDPFFLTDHVFSYESTCTVVGGECVKPGTATVYVVVGTSGHALEEQAYRPYPWLATISLSQILVLSSIGTCKLAQKFKTRVCPGNHFLSFRSRSKYQNCVTFGYERITANTTHMHVEYVTVSKFVFISLFL